MLKIIPGEPALVFSGSGPSTLLVSDLHLGLEKEMAKKGFRLPPSSVKMMERIHAIADSFRMEKVVVLGDVKHSVGKVEDIDWSVIPWFFETLMDIFGEVEVVPGNHDGNLKTVLPARVKLRPSDGVVLGEGRGRIGAAHGHAWPSEAAIATGNLVIGHSHFTYEMRDRYGSRSRESVWLFAGYDIRKMMAKAGYESKRRGEGRLVVMPPFNRLVGGHPINTGRPFEFGPVLSSGSVDLQASEIFLLDGTLVS